jgi:hypothetical protein
VKTLRETILKHSWQEDMVGPHLVRVDDALSAFRQWLADEGLAIVPREATAPMADVGAEARWQSAVRDANNVREIYRAMIAAAPDALREGE